MSKNESIPKLSSRVKGMYEASFTRPDGVPFVIRKIGTRYQVFILQGEWLMFFGEKEVGTGFPEAVVENMFKKNSDGGTKVMIDGKVYKVGGHGGTATVTPQFFKNVPQF